MNVSVGDVINCKDIKDMIETMHEAKKKGISLVWKAEDIRAEKHILYVTDIKCGSCGIDTEEECGT